MYFYTEYLFYIFMMIYNNAVQGTGVHVCGRVSPHIHFQLLQNSMGTKFNLHHTLENLIIVHLMCF